MSDVIVLQGHQVTPWLEARATEALRNLSHGKRTYDAVALAFTGLASVRIANQRIAHYVVIYVEDEGTIQRLCTKLRAEGLYVDDSQKWFLRVIRLRA